MRIRPLMILASFILTLAACKKGTFDPTSVEDAATAMTMFEDLDRLVEDAVKEEVGTMKTNNMEIAGNCPTVTIDWTNGNQFPATVTLDFGDSNCQGNDGRYRRGKVYAVINGLYQDAGTVVTITPENYFLDDHQVEGRKTVTNHGRNATGHWTFSITISEGLVTNPDGTTIAWASNQTTEWIEGDTTASILDDVYHINGSASGVDHKGTPFTMAITETLEMHLDCKWIEAGEITLTPEALPARILNYGDGGCDDLATVKVGILKVTIHLK